MLSNNIEHTYHQKQRGPCTRNNIDEQIIVGMVDGGCTNAARQNDGRTKGTACMGVARWQGWGQCDAFTNI